MASRTEVCSSKNLVRISCFIVVIRKRKTINLAIKAFFQRSTTLALRNSRYCWSTPGARFCTIPKISTLWYRRPWRADLYRPSRPVMSHHHLRGRNDGGASSDAYVTTSAGFFIGPSGPCFSYSAAMAAKRRCSSASTALAGLCRRDGGFQCGFLKTRGACAKSATDTDGGAEVDMPELDSCRFCFAIYFCWWFT